MTKKDEIKFKFKEVDKIPEKILVKKVQPFQEVVVEKKTGKQIKVDRVERKYLQKKLPKTADYIQELYRRLNENDK